MRHLILLLIITLSFQSRFYGQTSNSSCSSAAPFCSGSASQYPAGTNSQLPAGQYIGCLGSAPNPAFFTIPVTSTGALTLGISAAHDVDFICWGPFSTSGPNGPSTYCSNLNAANQVPNVPGVSNGCSYSGSATETLIIPNATIGEVYVLMVTNFSNQSQSINISPSGSGAIGGLSISGTSSVCAGKSATAVVTPGSSIQSVIWSGPSGYLGSNYAQTFNNIQTTTIYTLTGISITGQSCTATHEVSVSPTPTPIIINNSPICVNDPIVFTVSGGNNYLWSGPALYSSSAGPTASNTPITFTPIPSAQLANSGTYSVLVSLSTCTAIGTTYMLVKPNPTVTVSKAGDLCFGKSFSLLSNGATTYTWTGPNNFSFQGQNPLFLNNAFNMSGNYYVTGKTNGCTSTGTVPITINPLPNIIASSSGSVCQNSSLTLSASGGSTYAWAGPGLFTSHLGTVNIASSTLLNAGTYTVTGRDTNGCVNTATLNQTVRPVPYPNIYSADACITKNLLLSANGGATYKWSGPAYFTSSAQNPVISNASLLNSGVYNLTVTSTYGCVQTASVQGNVYMNPNVQVLGNIGACKDKVFSFSATGAINYKWLNSVGIVTESPTFAILASAPDLQSTYTLVGTDGHFCSSFVPFYPVVYQNPVALILPETEKNCAPFCTKINLNILSTNVTNYQWKFSDGETLPAQSDHYTKCFATPGITTVSVTLTDANTCTSVITRTIEAFVSPKADFIYTPDKPTENDNVITFMDNSQNTEVASWSWDFYQENKNTIMDTSEKSSVTLTYKDLGNYQVYLKVTGKNGCTDSITKIITLAEDPSFFVPSAFTPNGDGLNDLFMPKLVAVSIYQMRVFDRWGKLLFSTTDPTKGWDGKLNGGDVLTTDTYIYRFDVTGYDKTPKVYTGHFSLIK